VTVLSYKKMGDAKEGGAQGGRARAGFSQGGESRRQPRGKEMAPTILGSNGENPKESLSTKTISIKWIPGGGGSSKKKKDLTVLGRDQQGAEQEGTTPKRETRRTRFRSLKTPGPQRKGQAAMWENNTRRVEKRGAWDTVGNTGLGNPADPSRKTQEGRSTEGGGDRGLWG